MLLTLQQATVDPRLHQRLLDTHRQVWLNLLWSLTLAYAVSASNTLDQLGLDPGSSLEISYRA